MFSNLHRHHNGVSSLLLLGCRIILGRNTASASRCTSARQQNISIEKRYCVRYRGSKLAQSTSDEELDMEIEQRHKTERRCSRYSSICNNFANLNRSRASRPTLVIHSRPLPATDCSAGNAIPILGLFSQQTSCRTIQFGTVQ